MRPFPLVPAVVLLSAVACSDSSVGAIARDVRLVPSNAPRSLGEASSAAMSPDQPTVFFTINDSGNEPLLYALDTTGAGRGIWRVTGSTNVDWEATSVAPCAPGDTRVCVFIGDTGDNMFDRKSYAIYRVPEPVVGDSLLRDSVHADRLEFDFGGSHHNVEAMYVAPNGDIYLISKLLPKFAPWMREDARMYRIPRDAWTAGKRARATATGMTLHMTMISDASLSPDAHHLVVRTPKIAEVFVTDSATGAIDPRVPPTRCRLTILRQRQGEGVTWVDNAGRMVFVSEGRGAPLNIANCPLPKR